MDALKKEIDKGERINFSKVPSLDIVTSLVKLYLRELPTGLIPATSYDSLIAIRTFFLSSHSFRISFRSSPN